MDILIAKKLIEEGVLDFPKLLLKRYRAIGLSEVEALILIELDHQMQSGNTFLSPTKIAKNVTIDKDDLLKVLDGLMNKGYLTIQLKKGKNGKETEVFHLDETLKKILASYAAEIKRNVLETDPAFETAEAEIAHMIETQFQKPLTPLEVEVIQRWISDDGYDVLEIKKAVLDALKTGKVTIGYVDQILLKRKAKKQQAEVLYKPEKSEALKTFFDSWDNKK